MGNGTSELRGRISELQDQNYRLETNLSSTRDELQRCRNKYEDLEQRHKTLQQQIIGAQERYNLQLNTLKEELQTQNVKLKELLHVTEEFVVTSLELDRAKKSMLELQRDLQFSVDKAQKFEELHKHSASHAESEAKKVSELGRLLKDAKQSIRGMEDEMVFLQEELKLANDKIVSNLEHQNAQLRGEISSTKWELEENRKKNENLQLCHKKLQQQIIEDEERYNLQLSTLNRELQTQNMKLKELLHVKVESDVMCLEFESSTKRIQELQQKLQLSVAEAGKFKELHKQSASHAESEAKKVFEFKRLLEDAKQSIKGMEDGMASLQEELRVVNDKIVEYRKVEEAHKITTEELSAVQEELALTKSKLLELDHRLSLEDSIINKLTQELILRKNTQLKEDTFVLEYLFSSSMKELQEEISHLENAKFKLQEEENFWESVEAAFKPQEG